jgi:probable phosphoglycerate mutase
MSDRLELWLVRHGETTASAAGTVAGSLDVDLTERGRAEAAELRPILDGQRFDGVWSSTMRRAVDTARLAWGEPRQDPRLRELDFGELEGELFDAVDPVVGGPILAFERFACPGGESDAELRERIEGFLAELAPGRHLLFVHGCVIRTLTQPLGLARFVATGSIVRLDWRRRELLGVVEPENRSAAPGVRPR